MDPEGRRSKLEIYVDILEAVSNGTVGPTRIMYKANTSWQVLQETLDFLLSNGFLLEGLENSRRVYGLTEKGFRVLNDFTRIKEELVVSKPLNNYPARKDF
jgi:predicted transcriptional regulator